MTKRAALYARVSTRNGHQDPETQLLALRAVATRAGWEVVQEYVDHGVSGAKGRDKRAPPTAWVSKLRRESTSVAPWRSVPLAAGRTSPVAQNRCDRHGGRGAH